MALITCPDCGKPVSDLASSCPHCGRPPESAAPDSEVVAALVRGNKIEAIKLARERNPALDLAGAKAEVERIERTLPPGTVAKRGGCGTSAALCALAGALAALWIFGGPPW